MKNYINKFCIILSAAFIIPGVASADNSQFGEPVHLDDLMYESEMETMESPIVGPDDRRRDDRRRDRRPDNRGDAVSPRSPIPYTCTLPRNVEIGNCRMTPNRYQLGVVTAGTRVMYSSNDRRARGSVELVCANSGRMVIARENTRGCYSRSPGWRW